MIVSYFLFFNNIYVYFIFKPDGDMYNVTEWCMYNGNTFKGADMVEPEELPG